MSRFAPLERRPIAPVPAPKKPVGAQRRTHARRTESPAPIVTPFGRFPLGAPDHSSERDAERLAAQSSAGQPISRQAQALIGPRGRARSESGAPFPRLAVPSGDPLPDTVRD